jgi:hypothetical protein
MIAARSAMIAASGLLAAAMSAASPRAAEIPMARILWLEAVPGATEQKGELSLFREIPADDGRVAGFNRAIDTEAARFARRLAHLAWTRFGKDPVFRDPVLPIVVRDGGNHAARGLRIARPAGPEAHPALPYLILDPSPSSLGDTILHETGHLLQSLAMRGRDGARWSAFPHTTFAVSDPTTALSEGFAIHFEALWGHFGDDPAKRAYYHRLSPSFAPGGGRKAEFFAPVDDLMNFAQVWARYQAVRDGAAAFEGHVYPEAYPRSQMDPARDFSWLKTPNAMLASEGVAASVLFWTADGLAEAAGARPGAGLGQPAVVEAELALLDGFAALPAADSASFRPDLLDLVAALAGLRPQVADIVIPRFVDITRGVTARPALREAWHRLYGQALLLDLADAKAAIPKMDGERGEIVAAARRDPATLRAGVGPVLPVRLPSARFELKALGEAMAVEFDLNGISTAEYALMPGLDSAARERLYAERLRAPFASIADFTARTGLSLKALGLEDANDARRLP